MTWEENGEVNLAELHPLYFVLVVTGERVGSSNTFPVPEDFPGSFLLCGEIRTLSNVLKRRTGPFDKTWIRRIKQCRWKDCQLGGYCVGLIPA